MLFGIVGMHMFSGNYHPNNEILVDSGVPSPQWMPQPVERQRRKPAVKTGPFKSLEDLDIKFQDRECRQATPPSLAVPVGTGWHKTKSTLAWGSPKRALGCN